MRSLLLVLALGAAALMPSAALAAGPAIVPIIPPGNPGANQYLETVPTATGGSSGQTVFERATSGRRGTTAALPAATRSQLSRLGPDGRRAAFAAQATAPATLVAGTATGAGTTGASTGAAATGAPHRRTRGTGSHARSGPRRSGTTGAGGGNGPTTAAGAGAGGPRATPSPSSLSAETSGSAPVAAVLRSAIGDSAGGIDGWLPAALAVSAAVLAGLALRRRQAG